jgi:hypothetical protein
MVEGVARAKEHIEVKNRRQQVSVTCPLCDKPRLIKGSEARREKFRGMHIQCYRNRKLSGKKRQKIPEYGSIIDWPNHKGEWVPVKCGNCEKWHDVRASEARRDDYKGLHAECYDKIRKLTGPISIGKEGSTFHPEMVDPEDARKRGVTCGECKIVWYAIPRYGKTLEEWAGICPECKPRQHTGTVTLPKGTRAFLDINKRVRGGETSKDKVWIECRGCFEETRKLKLVWLSQVTKYLAGKDTWDELCSECLAERGPIRKLKQKSASSGTVTDFEQENENGVLIVYTCGHELRKPRQTARTSYKTRSAKCPDCQREEQSRALRLAKQILAGQAGPIGQMDRINLGNGNGQGNSDKRRRKPLTKQISKPKMVLGKTIEDLNAAILELYDDLGVNSEVTVPKVAFKIGLGRLDHGDEGRENIRRLLRGNNVQDKFPHHRDKVIATRHQASPMP